MAASTHYRIKICQSPQCRDFLIEEVVVHTLMAREIRAAKLYPAKQLEILKVFRKRLIEDVPVGLDNEDYIRFTFLRAKI
ncbi:MAG: hypothetical protein F6K14_28510 [Symploca sp. SIO2C1]|nr:hypothetical protein [Symploca sp. SIO2C1]